MSRRGNGSGDVAQRTRQKSDLAVESHFVVVKESMPVIHLKRHACRYPVWEYRFETKLVFHPAPRRVHSCALDTGYAFTNLYGLRWDAAQKTAYPPTFLIDRQGAVFFRKIVKEHGGRTTASEILDTILKPKPAK